MDYIKRILENKIRKYSKQFPCIAILGSRQCGKSTLVRNYILGKEAIFLDLERERDLRMLADPEAFFTNHKNKIICLDEIQRKPEIFRAMRYQIDQDIIEKNSTIYIVLGSASPELIQQSSESLAGRIGYLELTPFTYLEVSADFELTDVWFRGGYPLSLLCRDDESSLEWREQFILTYLERDLPALGLKFSTEQMKRLWQMCSHLTGQTINYSRVAASLGISQPTVKHYIDILKQTYTIRLLSPLITNLKKRVIKSPKIYIRDTGILQALLEIDSRDLWPGHPSYGQSWESFALENILSGISTRWNAFFYRTEKGAEMDLVLQRGDRQICVEFKVSTAPEVSRGFWNCIDDLDPEETWIICPITESYIYNKDKNVFVGGIIEFQDKFS